MKILLSLLLGFFITYYSPINYAETKPLVFATDATHPPFETYDSTTDAFSGYDIDITNALCKQMLIKCQFVHVPFQQLLDGLNKGKYDAVIRALSITPTRLKLVAFTNPYYDTNGSFIAATDKNLDLSPSKIANSTIGVQQGTTYETYLNAKYKNLLTIRPYQHNEEALADLANQQLTIVLGDTPVIKNWLATKNPGEYKIIGVTPPDKEIFGTGFGIAVRKNNQKLLNALNKALATIKKDGTYNKITQQYFGD